jgi:hypothetical protein
MKFDRILRRTWAILTKRENRAAADQLLNALMKYQRLSGEQAQRIFDRTRIKPQKENNAVSLFSRSFGFGLRRSDRQPINLFMH